MHNYVCICVYMGVVFLVIAMRFIHESSMQLFTSSLVCMLCM